MFQTCEGFSDNRIAHGFFGRRGGVSQGVYASLNCGLGSGDDREAVHENRARVANALGLGQISSLYQVHGATCHVIDRAMAERVEGDALVTAQKGVALGILTADCGPVLFHGTSPSGPVIGAAHAGWGGALKGILEETIGKMIAQGAEPETIHAAIGPAIGPESYEVSENFLKPFLAEDAESILYFKPGSQDKFWFDLPTYIKFRLKRAGLRKVFSTGIDTYREEADYFSFRRATHRGEKDYGRQVSIIAIR